MGKWARALCWSSNAPSIYKGSCTGREGTRRSTNICIQPGEVNGICVESLYNLPYLVCDPPPEWNRVWKHGTAGGAHTFFRTCTVTSQILFYVVLAALLGFVVYRSLRFRSVRKLSASEAESRVHSGVAIFLDVRTEAEARSEHIRGALHIPLHELRLRGEELRRHAGKEIICYCQTGNRSVSAALILKKLGLNVSSLEGGIGEWNFYRRSRA